MKIKVTFNPLIIEVPDNITFNYDDVNEWAHDLIEDIKDYEIIEDGD